ncbi:MAG: malate dehydrogenase [Methanobacteriota archaeon]
MFIRNKITIVGSGHVGATVAHIAAIKELGDVVLVDVVEGLPQGIALDIASAAPIEGFDCGITGTSNYENTKNSDVVIITAGLARKPGMSRDDLLEKNAAIVKSISTQAAKYSPEACVIVVTNPLDAMAYVAKKASGFPKNRVMGMAGVLDSARLRAFIAMELNVSPCDVSAMVLGGHGDAMVPIISHCTVAGVPLAKLLSKKKIEAIIERTRNAGAEVLSLLKTSSAYYSPAASVIEMAEAVLKDRKKVLPCSAYLAGEYGVHNCFAGVPVKLGAEGVEEIIEIELTEEERKLFLNSVNEVKKLVGKLKL